MNMEQILQTLGERIHGNARMNMMYGTPFVVEGKTIIPIGRVAYGFGAGRAPGLYSTMENREAEFGTGMGGGLVAHPVGVIEITAHHTRFIPCQDKRKYIWALFVGICLGMWFRARL